jgi:2-succinyl-5-enolpyruvyl-6-hydroxy-3-cyclohexene-1-carboxylate synthase
VPAALDTSRRAGRAEGPWTRSPARAVGSRRDRRGARALAPARRPLVGCGPRDDPDAALAAAVAALARALGAPVVAEPASNLRRPALEDVLADAHDAGVRHAGFAAAHVQDAVVRLGAPPTSKALAAWLAERDEAAAVILDEAAPGLGPPASPHVVRGALAPVRRPRRGARRAPPRGRVGRALAPARAPRRAPRSPRP